MRRLVADLRIGDRLELATILELAPNKQTDLVQGSQGPLDSRVITIFLPNCLEMGLLVRQFMEWVLKHLDSFVDFSINN